MHIWNRVCSFASARLNCESFSVPSHAPASTHFSSRNGLSVSKSSASIAEVGQCHHSPDVNCNLPQALQSATRKWHVSQTARFFWKLCRRCPKSYHAVQIPSLMHVSAISFWLPRRPRAECASSMRFIARQAKSAVQLYFAWDFFEPSTTFFCVKPYGGSSRAASSCNAKNIARQIVRFWLNDDSISPVFLPNRTRCI